MTLVEYILLYNIHIEILSVTLKQLGYYMIVFYFFYMKKIGKYGSFPFNNKGYNKVARKCSDI